MLSDCKVLTRWNRMLSREDGRLVEMSDLGGCCELWERWKVC